MTRSTLSPVRRFTAALALAGVAGLGGVVAAPAALADEPVVAAPVTEVAQPLVVSLPNAEKEIKAALPALLNRATMPPTVESPLPDAPVTFKLDKFAITLRPQAAQQGQTVLATLYSSLGYTVVFDSHGRLVIGPKFCDPKKKPEKQVGCIPTGGPRF